VNQKREDRSKSNFTADWHIMMVLVRTLAGWVDYFLSEDG
jgi:hypothetical protein